jgi:hypothetical protein
MVSPKSINSVAKGWYRLPRKEKPTALILREYANYFEEKK